MFVQRGHGCSRRGRAAGADSFAVGKADIKRVLCDDSVLPLSFLFELLQQLSFTQKAMTSWASGGYEYSATSVLSLISPREFQHVLLIN